MSQDKISDKQEDYIVLHQTVRSSIANFDSILVSLLTQGNTFVLAILSLPLAAKLEGFRAAVISLFAFIFTLFLLLGNMLYRSLLACAVKAAEHIESKNLAYISIDSLPTNQLSKIPLSATRGSAILYLGLPLLWLVIALLEMMTFLKSETILLKIVFLLICTVLVCIGIIIWFFVFRDKST